MGKTEKKLLIIMLIIALFGILSSIGLLLSDGYYVMFFLITFVVSALGLVVFSAVILYLKSNKQKNIFLKKSMINFLIGLCVAIIASIIIKCFL